MNKLKSTVKDICKKGGIDGNFTNHSLRATCASRLFDQNVPEQIIKEITGHRSDCVRVYKRTADHLREVASNIVSGENVTKKPKIEDIEEGNICDGDNVVEDEVDVKDKKLSYAQMVKNVVKTRDELRRKKVIGCRVRAKCLLTRAKRFCIDLNLNMKMSK